jgi:hypothetical protein
MRAKIFFCVVSFALLLSSCAPAQPTLTAVLTVTSVPPTETPLPTATSTPEPTATASDMKTVCPQISIGKENVATGRLLLVDYDTDRIVAVDLETMKAGEPISTDDQKVLSTTMSPNGNWVAYEALNKSTNEAEIVVKGVGGTTGEKEIHIPWKQNKGILGYWLSNEVIMLKLWSNDYHRALIMNPFSGESKELVANFPAMFFDPLDWNGVGPFAYNSTLNRVVYANYNQSYVMWDIDDNEPLITLQSISFINFSTKAPQWTLDGTKVLIAAPKQSLNFMNDELYSIDIDGNATILTDLSNYYSEVSIDQYSWSPDERYVAMLAYFSPNEIEGEQLVVLDTQTKNMDIYCLKGDLTSDYRRRNQHGMYNEIVYKGVVWSPDGNRLVVENRTSENSSSIILVNILTKSAYEVLNGVNYQPIGWSNK